MNTLIKTMTRSVVCSAITIAALLGALTTAAHAAGELQDIVKRGELRIGYMPAAPGVFKDPKTGTVTGYYVDGIASIAEEMGVKPVFVESTWSTYVAALQSGQIDMSIGGTFATVKRAMVLDFTRPFVYLGHSAIVRADETRFNELADMNNPDVRIAAMQGGVAESFVRQHMPKAKLIALNGSNLTASFVEVAAGRADVGISDAHAVRQFASKQPGVKDLFAGRPYNFLPISWTVKKGNNELLSVLNTGMEALLISGRWAEMARPYGDTGRYVDQPQFVDFPGEAKAK